MEQETYPLRMRIERNAMRESKEDIGVKEKRTYSEPIRKTAATQLSFCSCGVFAK